MAKLQIIPVGTKFNRLKYLGDAPSRYVNNKAIRYCYFVCECGTKKETKLSLVKKGDIKSCGCLNSEVRSIMTAKRNLIHGMAKIDGKRNPTYMLLNNIKARCYKETHVSYHNYGGRGISVCDEWLDHPKNFHEWCLNNGYKKGLEIDRIDNNGNYEPNNCRFVTTQVNGNNKRNNRRYTVYGEILTMAEISVKYNIKWNTLRGRIDYSGWSIHKAIETPINTKYINGRHKRTG